MKQKIVYIKIAKLHYNIKARIFNKAFEMKLL